MCFWLSWKQHLLKSLGNKCSCSLGNNISWFMVYSILETTSFQQGQGLRFIEVFWFTVSWKQHLFQHGNVVFKKHGDNTQHSSKPPVHLIPAEIPPRLLTTRCRTKLSKRLRPLAEDIRPIASVIYIVGLGGCGVWKSRPIQCKFHYRWDDIRMINLDSFQ